MANLKSDVDAKGAFAAELRQRGYSSVEITRSPADITARKAGKLYYFEIKYTRQRARYFGAATLTEWAAAVENEECFRFVVCSKRAGQWTFQEYTPADFMGFSSIPPFKVYFTVAVSGRPLQDTGRVSKSIALTRDRLALMLQFYREFRNTGAVSSPSGRIDSASDDSRLRAPLEQSLRRPGGGTHEGRLGRVHRARSAARSGPLREGSYAARVANGVSQERRPASHLMNLVAALNSGTPHDYVVTKRPDRFAHWWFQVYRRKLEAKARAGGGRLVVSCDHGSPSPTVFAIPYEYLLERVLPNARLERDGRWMFEVRKDTYLFVFHQSVKFDGRPFLVDSELGSPRPNQRLHPTAAGATMRVRGRG